MKIHQLAMGARFLYQGEEYVKTGPMFGTGKDGPRVFPRYLVLQPLDDAAPTSENRAALPRNDVLKAFETFYAVCRSAAPVEQSEVLERAREQFLRALG